MEMRLKLIAAAKSRPESKVSRMVKRAIRKHKENKPERRWTEHQGCEGSHR